MHRLSQRFSPPLLTLENPGGLGSTTYHSFPAPHLLPTQLDNILRAIGFGYRAKFIESSLATLRAQFGQTPGNIEAGLATWRTSNVDHVREKLLELKGVGRKVADCVMLMCLDQVSLSPQGLADLSPPSSLSTPTWRPLPLATHACLLAFETSPFQSSCTTTFSLFCWRGGVL